MDINFEVFFDELGAIQKIAGVPRYLSNIAQGIAEGPPQALSSAQHFRLPKGAQHRVLANVEGRALAKEIAGASPLAAQELKNPVPLTGRMNMGLYSRDRSRYLFPKTAAGEGFIAGAGKFLGQLGGAATNVGKTSLGLGKRFVAGKGMAAGHTPWSAVQGASKAGWNKANPSTANKIVGGGILGATAFGAGSMLSGNKR